MQFQTGLAIYIISISLGGALSIYMYACMWAFWLLSTFRKQLQESISCASVRTMSLKQCHDLHSGTVSIPDGSGRQQGSKPATNLIFLWLLLYLNTCPLHSEIFLMELWSNLSFSLAETINKNSLYFSTMHK